MAPASLNPARRRNKCLRQSVYANFKKCRINDRRQHRLQRRKLERSNPSLAAARRSQNPVRTLESKRSWDSLITSKDITNNLIGLNVNINHIPQSSATRDSDSESGEWSELFSHDSEVSDDDDVDRELISSCVDPPKIHTLTMQRVQEILGPCPSLPKLLITTTLTGSVLHEQAKEFAKLFPTAHYVPRKAHKFSHSFSLQDIIKFATNRQFTMLCVLGEIAKRIDRITMLQLPCGPRFDFSLTNWIHPSRIPGHGTVPKYSSLNVPELILNNFNTPLGHLTAQFLRRLLPPTPHLSARQVITLHNQRDYIFFRRHRYIFRNKRPTEHTAKLSNGQKIHHAVQDIRAGLQDLGPHFTLKLRRITTTATGTDSLNFNTVIWRWTGRSEKQRNHSAL